MKLSKKDLKNLIMEEMSSALLEGPQGLSPTDVQQVKADSAAQTQADPDEKPGQASMQTSEIRPELMAVIQQLSGKGIDDRERALILSVLNTLISAAQAGNLATRARALDKALTTARVKDMAGL